MRKSKKFKKVMAMILAAALTVSFAACGGEGSAGPENSSEGGSLDAGEYQVDTIKFSIMDDPGTFTPWYGYVELASQIINLYEPLMDLNPEDHTLMPRLAEGYESVSDGVYDVKLYDYIKDSNGNAMKASDVVFSIEKCREAGTYAFAVTPIKSVEAVDEYTVRFTLENEKKDSIEIILSQINIITEAGFEQSGDEMVKNPIGTGAYKVSDYVPGSRILLEARSDYWQKDELRSEYAAANAKYIDLVCLADISANAIALESGEIDLSFAIADEDQAKFIDFDTKTAKDGYSCHIFPAGQCRMLVYNCSENSPLQDVNLRKALSYAVDAAGIVYSTDRYIGVVYNDIAANPIYSDVPEELLREDGEYFPYDVETAKEYLEKSSYNGETLTLIVNSMEGMVTGATLIASYAEAIGINIDVQSYETAIYSEMQRDETGTKYDIDYMSQENYFAMWAALQVLDANNYISGKNHNFIYDETLQELYDKAAALNSTDEDVMALTEYIDENCYAYAINYCNHVNYGSDRVVKFLENGRTMRTGAMEYQEK